MSLQFDDFFHPGRNKHSSQHIQKQFKNRHRRHKSPKSMNEHVSHGRRGVAMAIETGVKDFSSDEDMFDSFQQEKEADWICEACRCMNSGSCSQCSVCASSQRRSVTNAPSRITLGSFLSRPQAMELDDEPNNANQFLQNAIHLSFQDMRPSPVFAMPQANGSPVPTTTTYAMHLPPTPAFMPAMVVPVPVMHGFPMNPPPQRIAEPRRRRHKRRRFTSHPDGFDDYWTDARTNGVNLPAHQHYERNPDDMTRSFEPIGTRQEFKLKFGVPKAIGESSGRGSARGSGARQNPKKVEREERKARKLAEFYRHIYLGRDRREKLEISRIIRLLFAYVPGELRQRKQFDGRGFNECQACYAVVFDENKCDGIVIPHCGHQTLCSDCFDQYLQIRIQDEDIVPWLPCPMPDCKTCVPPNTVISHLSLENLYRFASIFLRQHLKRNSNWVSCETDGCEFGFVRTESSVCDTQVCDACGEEQNFSVDVTEDDGFAELIASGAMRLCPKCEWPTMKDYGMCNVMQCGQCGIWWNWETRDCGTSSTAVKSRARRGGTLWGAGELQYQWDLQLTDLPAFIELLAQNGIKYDPNYVRGSG